MPSGLAGAGGVEDEAVVAVAEQFADARHARRRDPEHRQAQRRPGLGSGRHRVGRHAADGVRRVAEHLAGDPVQAGHVGHRVQHGDVARPHVGRDVTGRHRGHHDLGEPDRERPHGGRDQRGAAGPAQAYDGRDVACPGAREVLQRHRHRRHRAAPVTGEDRGRAVRVVGRDLGGGNVDVPGGPSPAGLAGLALLTGSVLLIGLAGLALLAGPVRADVDRGDGDAFGGDEGGHVLKLVTFGVECADHVDTAHESASTRPSGR